MRTTSRYSLAVAAEVRAELARRSLTQEWLSAETGIPLSTLNTRCRGAQPFLITELAVVSDALDVDVSHFLPALGDVA